MAGHWPNPSQKPPAALRRHLVKVHGLRLDGTETAAECEEAEGWLSQHKWDKSCGNFAVNRPTLAAVE